MSVESDAKAKATGLVIKLIESQPSLIAPQAPTADNGKEVGDFIVALRDRLTALYQRQP